MVLSITYNPAIIPESLQHCPDLLVHIERYRNRRAQLSEYDEFLFCDVGRISQTASPCTVVECISKSTIV